MKKHCFILTACSLLFAGSAQAQSTGFADDFSSNPFLLSIDQDGTVSEADGITVAEDGL